MLISFNRSVSEYVRIVETKVSLFQWKFKLLVAPCKCETSILTLERLLNNKRISKYSTSFISAVVLNWIYLQHSSLRTSADSLPAAEEAASLLALDWVWSWLFSGESLSMCWKMFSSGWDRVRRRSLHSWGVSSSTRRCSWCGPMLCATMQPQQTVFKTCPSAYHALTFHIKRFIWKSKTSLSACLGFQMAKACAELSPFRFLTCVLSWCLIQKKKSE